MTITLNELLYMNNMLETSICDQEFISICNFCAILTKTYDESHDLQHHFNVYKSSIEILKLSTSSKNNLKLFKLITYSSLLHDTVDHKYQESIKNKKMLYQYLEIMTGKNMCNEIKWIINNISYSKEVKNGVPFHSNEIVFLARNIVSDADKLEALGDTGIIRCKQYAKAKFPQYSNQEIIDYVVNHCHEKLLLLKDNFMRTDAGKFLAIPRHNELLTFVEFNKKND